MLFKSEYPPPKPTSLERWLTVANKERYTATTDNRPAPLLEKEREELLAEAGIKFGSPRA